MEQDNNKFPHNLKVGDKVIYETRGWYIYQSIVSIIGETKTRFKLSNGKEVDKGKTWTRGNKYDRGYIEELTPEKEAKMEEDALCAKYRKIIDIEGRNLEALARNQNLTSVDLKQVIDKLEEIEQILNK